MRRCAVAAVVLALLTVGQPAARGASSPTPGPDVTAARHDTSAPLRQMARGATKTPDVPRSATVTVRKPNPTDRQQAMNDSDPGPPYIPDPTGPAPGQNAPAQADGFEGINNAQLGNTYYPPDTDGDIGPNHYVQIVNAAFAVYDRSGNVQFGPANINTLWSGFGGACENFNDGDPIVQYDQFADRWLISQFAVSAGPPYYECVAISATSDPTGAYHRYRFSYADFPDYPKIGVWPDAYYVSYNMYTPSLRFSDAKFCALDRTSMLAGSPATQQCFGKAEKPSLASEFSLLPSDVDGMTAPPAGAPNYFVGESWDQQDELTMYKFHVDWATPANTTLTGPVTIGVNPFTWACVNVGGQCVPQPGTTQTLDSLGGRAMYRLAYRNFGTHQSLLMNHTVAMDGQLGLTAQTGVGWYEIRDPGAVSPVVHQQGTTADPDGSTFRTMGSMAMDQDGNIALGYSRSGSSTYPGIAYIGRKAGDPLNQMPQAEVIVRNGAGVQTGTRGRWGDYSAMQIDPTDECTFWYTNEYMAATSVKSWSTRVAHFSFPSCLGQPERPASVTAVGGDLEATVSWTQPNNNGSPITEYTVTSTPASDGCSTSSATATTCTVKGLRAATPYVFTVRATNANGTGPGAVSNAVTTYGPPSAPGLLTAAAGDAAVQLSWSPASGNGYPILDYTVTSWPASSGCTTAATSCVVSGLSNGTPYTFYVTARNQMGSGPAASTQATPIFAGGLVVSAARVVKPAASVPVSIAGSSPSCQVAVSLDGTMAPVPIAANGTGAVNITAPKPNGAYTLTANQGGPGCVAATVSRQVRVKGVYLSGTTSVKKGATQSYKAHQFVAGRQITWKVKRNGNVKLKKTKTVSSGRTSKIGYTFGKKGTYKVIAWQANSNIKAKLTVTVS